MSVIASKVISLTQTLLTSTSLTVQTNGVGFNPDECVVKHISWYDSNADYKSAGLYTITTNLTPETVASFSPNIMYDSNATLYMLNCTCSPNVSIKLPNGATNITFTVANQISTYSTDGKICITLEFLKHKT